LKKKGSEVCVYGNLSGLLITNIDSNDIVTKNKKLTSFYLGEYVQRKNMLSLFLWSTKLMGLLQSGLHSKVASINTFEEAPEAIFSYISNMTKGKALFRCSTATK
jgi:NADPH:quinone reductase-like Zn-dependent oxidoreductase